MEPAEFLRIEALRKTYDRVVAIERMSLAVKAGELVTLLGPSGSGKTTLLMAIAGFAIPDSGRILLDGRDITHAPPHRRGLGVVFQQYALFPHLSVAGNVAYPLAVRRMARPDRRRAVADALRLVQLEGLDDRQTRQLSGGQQQRVALARALVFKPPVLLMDEPLGALDRKLREQMQLEIKRIQKSLGITVIYVTHDQEEALILSDRIAIMHEGEVHQIGAPDTVYEHPSTPYVASFLGESNFLDGILESTEGGTSWVRLASGERIAAQATAKPIGTKVRAMVRPESVAIGAPSSGETVNTLPAAIEVCEYLGQSIRYFARGGGATLTVRAPRADAARRAVVGERVTLHWPQSETLLFG